VFSELGRLKEMQSERRANGADMMIGVAGCVAQAEGEEIARRAPVVDMVFGPQAYHKPARHAGCRPEASATCIQALKRAVIDTDFPEEDKFDHLPAARKEVTDQARADRLSDGAGRLRQVLLLLRRPLYARRRGLAPGRRRCWPKRAWLVEAGVKEITLLGQNVNAYHGLDDCGPRVLGWANWPICWLEFRGWNGCATPPAIPATWTTR
jgi:tRNA-2-methylthio-N6-dimethylallyladenosine synthase